MKRFSYRFKILLLMFSIPILAGWTGYDQNALLLSEAGYSYGKPSTPPPPIPPGRPHTWGSDPGGVIYDGYYPPFIVYPRYGHPQAPHRYHPLYPPPYRFYPPYYEPEKPWYKDEMPVPAGRVMLLVDPLHAEAFVNGHPLPRHPDLSYEAGLLKGEYIIMVSAEGYETYNRTVEIRGGEMIRLTIRLEQNERK